MTEACFAAFDTSNYTSSFALAKDGAILRNVRIPLKVEEGERGLRQSDAVFQHTVRIPMLADEIGEIHPLAVGCSVSPRDAEGSYMPCFLAGIAAATVLASSHGVPLYRFSHQAGHVAAALYSAGRLDLFDRECLAFHVSGGTTELLHIKGRKIEKIGGTLDISAGKLVDRIGVDLGLTFPCGAALEKLALGFDGKLQKERICVKGCDCNLSGAENKGIALIQSGVSHEQVAYFTLDFIARTLTAMTENALQFYPGLPVLYAGGVMSNKIIGGMLALRFENCLFAADSSFSCDNAAGIALLTEQAFEEGMGHGE